MRTPTFVLPFIFILFCSIRAEEFNLLFHPQSHVNGSSLIWFNVTSYQNLSHQVDNFLEIYRNPSLTEGRAEHLIDCKNKNGAIPNNALCHFETESLAPCVKSDYFGYKKGKPCIFIEFNKVLNFQPKLFTPLKNLSKTMPEDLKRKLIAYQEDKLEDEINQVWLHCDGETAVDKEAMGPISYIPHQGFPGYMFPYTGQKGYLNPITAVLFQNPDRGMLINVVCKAWSPGIKQESGTVSFSLLIEV